MNAVDELNFLLGIGPPKPQLPLVMQRSGYAFIKLLGKGSFGQAFLSMRRRDDRKEFVVVKHVNLTKMSKKQRKDAKNEILILQKLVHPNVIRYIESYEENQQLYIVMEYAANGDLSSYLQTGSSRIVMTRPLPEEEVLSLFIQVVMAVEYMHERHLLHRDIKSQNVFLTGNKRIVKLGDFGITILLQHTLAMASTMCGTPCYFSPEICHGKKYNSKSDVWSLGVLLYEMCCHRLPFESNSMKGLMQDICFKDVGTSDRRGKYFPLQYSDELWKLIIQLLQKNPADRPTVQEILQLPFIRRQMPNVMKILQTELDAMAVSTPRNKKNSPRHAPKTPKGAPPPPPPRGRVVAAESGMDGGSGPSAREDPSSMSPGLRAALAYYGEGQKADDLTEKNPTDRRGAASPKVDDKSAEKPSLKELLQLYDDQKKKVNKSDGNRKADPRGREEETEHRHSEAKPQRRADGYRGEPPVLSAAARQGNAPRFSKEEAAAQYSEETEEEEEEEGEECMEEDYANPETYQEDLKNVLQRLTVHMSVDEAPANDRKAPRQVSEGFENEDEPPLDIQKVMQEHEMFLQYMRKNKTPKERAKPNVNKVKPLTEVVRHDKPPAEPLPPPLFAKESQPPFFRGRCLCGKVQLTLVKEHTTGTLNSSSFTCHCPSCVEVSGCEGGATWVNVPSLASVTSLLMEGHSSPRDYADSNAAGGATTAVRALSTPSSPSQSTIKSYSFSKDGAEYSVFFCRICGTRLAMKHGKMRGTLLSRTLFKE